MSVNIALTMHGGEHIPLVFSCIQAVGASGDVPVYTGEYTVEPDIAAQTLATRGKRMGSDVTVLGIPYHEVANPFDGATAIIGGIEYYGV